jgi:hypothetical protein
LVGWTKPSAAGILTNVTNLQVDPGLNAPDLLWAPPNLIIPKGSQKSPTILSVGLIYPNSIPHLPPLPTSRDDWGRFYEAVIRHRIERAYACAVSEDARIEEILRCERDGRYWLATYGAIYEARTDHFGEGSRSGTIPWVPYPFQFAVWDWLEERLKSRGAEGDGLLPKARDMGLSNLLGAFALHKWLTMDPFQGRFVSYKEEVIDRQGDPDSIFWKIELLLKAQPRWMLDVWARGFDWKSDRTDRRFYNPLNGNLLSGESTTALSGTGRRATVYFFDEWGKNPMGGVIWDSAQGVTDHRLATGSAWSGFGLHQYNLHHKKGAYKDTRTPVLEIGFQAHPYHDPAWEREQRERTPPEVFAREYLMDYFAGAATWIYPETHGKSVGDYPFEPYAGPLIASLDDGLDDQFYVNWVQYIKKTGRHRIVQSYYREQQPTRFLGSVLTGIPISTFRYDQAELDLMEWVRHLPGLTYCGDSHGFNREQIAGQAPFDLLRSEFNIHVFVDFHKRSDKDKRTFTHDLLSMTDFNDTPWVEHTLWCFQNHKFPSLQEGRQRVSPVTRPVEDGTSHAVTSYEYYCTLWDQLSVISGQNRIVYDGPDSVG